MDQQQGYLITAQPQSTDTGAKTAGCKTKTREVHSRYLQSRPTPALQRPAENLNLGGRRSDAACKSTGWVGLGTTPVPSSATPSSAVLTQPAKRQPREAVPTPAPGTMRRALQCPESEQPWHRQACQQRQQHRKQEASYCTGRSSATAFAATPQAPVQQQQQLHDVQILSDTSRRFPSTAPPIPPLQLHGVTTTADQVSSRSSNSRSARPDSSGTVVQPLLRQSGYEGLRTPQLPRLASSVMIGGSTAKQLDKLGMSADVAALSVHATTTAKGAGVRRRQLEEYKQQKRLEQQQIAQRNATRGSQGGFKEPHPQIWKQEPSATTAGVRIAVGTGTSVVSAGSAVADRTQTVDSHSSPSQFTATMKTLQQSGSGSKTSRPSSGSISGGKSVRPPGVPVLQMERLQQAADSLLTVGCAKQPQEQTGRSPFAPGSCSRIPQFSSGGHTPGAPLLSSRVVTSAAHVPLPDATPRTTRDAPLSKLPKTPRGTITPVEAMQDKDVTFKQSKPAVPGLKLGGLEGAHLSQTVAVAMDGAGTHRGSSADVDRSVAATADKAASSQTRQAAGSMPPPAARPLATPPSARRSSSIGTARQAGRYTSSNSTMQPQQQQQQPQPELSRVLKTPRLLSTPRAPQCRPEARKSDQERAEETKQQLRLLRNQNMQLRHLAARVEQAVQQKQDKAAAVLASAAAAIVDLYGQLAAVQKQLQQQQWQSTLTQVVQRQLPKLREWCSMQAQNELTTNQLQHACSTALSHVPLMNGAAVGQLPEQPNLELLQQQLMHGMQMLQEAQPALQKLLGPDLLTAHSSRAASTAEEARAMQPYGTSSSRKSPDVRSSVRTTATLAEQLMCVAADECKLLGQLAQQVDRLSDLHLYANSMQVQLAHMKQSNCMSPGL